MTRSATARLFVAIELPEDVREHLAGWARATLASSPARERIRVLDMELLHVTVCFLGNRPVEEMEALVSRLPACDNAVGELSLGAPLWLPTRRPRALAVEVHDEDGALAQLHQTVVEAVEDINEDGSRSRPRTPRRFHPHVTVARMRGNAAPRERVLSATPSLSFIPNRLVLYRSWLSANGASYEPIASSAFPDRN